jgi:hypothetical protein
LPTVPHDQSLPDTAAIELYRVFGWSIDLKVKVQCFARRQIDEQDQMFRYDAVAFHAPPGVAYGNQQARRRLLPGGAGTYWSVA